MEFGNLLEIFWINLPTIATLIGVAVLLGNYISRTITRKVKELEMKIYPGIAPLPNFIKSHRRLLEILVSRSAIESLDHIELSGTILDAVIDGAEAGVATLRPTENPVTQDDIDTLKRYVSKAKNREDFTIDEAKDFEALAKRVEDEPQYEHHAGVVLLTGLAGMILGSLLSKNSEN